MILHCSMLLHCVDVISGFIFVVYVQLWLMLTLLLLFVVNYTTGLV
jgi:hypothetical protein